MKFTILIIDDEKNIREGLAANFELEDYNVKTAASGKEGLELISKGDIDLVITDLRMPGISGEEVLNHVVTETPGIPVIILTKRDLVENYIAYINQVKNIAIGVDIYAISCKTGEGIEDIILSPQHTSVI